MAKFQISILKNTDIVTLTALVDFIVSYHTSLSQCFPAQRVCMFHRNRCRVCATESSINTYTKSRATKYEMQLKFYAKSYLPARINSTALESISALFQAPIARAQA